MLSMEIVQLIERCRKGDDTALGELYKAYAQRMKRVCRRYVNDENTVNDILHDSFVIIFTSFDKLRDFSKAESWMMAITRNVASKYKEHLLTHPLISLEETNDALALSQENDGGEIKGVPFAEVIKMIDKLPNGYGKVFRLSVFEGLSHKEIALLLGIEAHSSSSQLTRAKKMLRMMMHRYWALLLLLIIPISIIFIKKDKPSGVIEKPVVSERQETPDNHTKEDQHIFVSHTVPNVVDSSLTIITDQAISVLLSDTLNTVLPKQTVIDTIRNEKRAGTEQDIHESKRPRYNLAYKQADKSRSKNTWHVALSYAGFAPASRTTTANYMTMPAVSGVTTRATTIYNWGDYMNYVVENASNLDPISAQNMKRVAIINSNHPSEPLIESKHHEIPLTLQLSLSRELSSNWSLSTGFSYTRMKSSFEVGNDNTLIHRDQQLHYLGIPLRMNYNIINGDHQMLYTSGGVQLDVPIKGSLTTQYHYGSSYTTTCDSPMINTRIHAPLQLSIGLGAGIQYEIIPRVNLFIEADINYNIPMGTSIESYRTDHPVEILLPVGVRFKW